MLIILKVSGLLNALSNASDLVIVPSGVAYISLPNLESRISLFNFISEPKTEDVERSISSSASPLLSFAALAILSILSRKETISFFSLLL